MSLPTDGIPELNAGGVRIICEAYGLEWDDDDLTKQIEFSLKFQAIIRYIYADAMMAVRPT